MACEFNLNFLKELEREAVLEVLYRDQMVRKTEEERIRYLPFPYSCISVPFFSQKYSSSSLLSFQMSSFFNFLLANGFLFFGKTKGYPEPLGFAILLTTIKMRKYCSVNKLLNEFCF